MSALACATSEIFDLRSVLRGVSAVVVAAVACASIDMAPSDNRLEETAAEFS